MLYQKKVSTLCDSKILIRTDKDWNENAPLASISTNCAFENANTEMLLKNEPSNLTV